MKVLGRPTNPLYSLCVCFVRSGCRETKFGTFHMDFEAKCGRRLIQVTQLIVEKGIVGVEQHGDEMDLGRDFVHLAGKEAHAGEIAAGVVETRDQTQFDGVRANREHDGSGRSRRLHGERRNARQIATKRASFSRRKLLQYQLLVC
jgi:hypothetical protein